MFEFVNGTPAWTWIQPQDPAPSNETKRLQVTTGGQPTLYAFLRADNGFVHKASRLIFCRYPGESPGSRYWWEGDTWEEIGFLTPSLIFTEPFQECNNMMQESLTADFLRTIFWNAYETTRKKRSKRILDCKPPPNHSARIFLLPPSEVCRARSYLCIEPGCQRAIEQVSFSGRSSLFAHQMRYHNPMWEACPHPDCEGRSTLYPLLRPHWDAVHNMVKCQHCGLETEKRRISRHNYLAHGEGGKLKVPRLCFNSLQLAPDSALDNQMYDDGVIVKLLETKTSQEDEEFEEDQQFEEDILAMQDVRPFDSLITRFCSWYSSSPNSVESYPLILASLVRSYISASDAWRPETSHSARMGEEWILPNFVNSEGPCQVPNAKLHNLGTSSRTPTPDNTLREDVLARNISCLLQNPKLKLALPAAGTKCRGAMVVMIENFNFEPCENDRDIALDTASLKIKHIHYPDGWDNVFKLELRCTTCHAQYKINSVLKQLGMFRIKILDGFCDITNCRNRRMFPHSTCCHTHFISASWKHKIPELPDIPVDLTRLFRDLEIPVLSLGSAWKKLKHAMDHAAKARCVNLRLGGIHEFVFVDTEFSYDRVDSSLELHEVTFLDTRGQIILDVLIDWASSVEAHALGFLGNRPTATEEVQEARFRTYSRRFQGSDKSLVTVSGLADAMKACGINNTTTLVEWSTGSCDMRILSQVFRTFGLFNILDQSLSLVAIPAWKKALPIFNCFRLDTIFPLLFPRSSLVGKNHRSRVDTEQLYKMILLLLGLTDPAEMRNLDMFYPPNERLQEGAPLGNPCPGRLQDLASSFMDKLSNSKRAEESQFTTPPSSLKTPESEKSTQVLEALSNNTTIMSEDRECKNNMMMTTAEKPKFEQNMQSFASPSRSMALVSEDWEEHERERSVQSIKTPPKKIGVASEESKTKGTMECLPRQLESGSLEKAQQEAHRKAHDREVDRIRMERKNQRVADAIKRFGPFRCGIGACPKVYHHRTSTLRTHRQEKHPGWVESDISKFALQCNRKLINASNSPSHPRKKADIKSFNKKHNDRQQQRKSQARKLLGPFRCGFKSCLKTYQEKSVVKKHRDKKHAGWTEKDILQDAWKHNLNLISASRISHQIISNVETSL